MPASVIAIGLDALDPRVLEKWLDEDKLPFLTRLAREGTYARQRNFSLYRTENSWLTLLQGCAPETSHEWGHQNYDAGNYALNERAAYEFRLFPPFYALDGKPRVAAFDVPLTRLVPGVNGVQLLGWGTEVNQILRESSPPGLMAELIGRHGRHPLYDTITNADDGSETLSYRIPCLYDIEVMRSVRDKLVSAAGQRTAIIGELLDSDNWDLLFCTYGEIHTAGHQFWHIGRDHPLREAFFDQAGSDFMLDILQEIDRNLAALLADVPDDTTIVIFSPHGMQANSIDLYSMVFLPELIYRWSTGTAAFKGLEENGEPSPLRFDYSRHWSEEIWDLRTPHGDAVLESPEVQDSRGDPLYWDPGNWYRSAWPGMRAFVLPGYSEGLIRINVAGRDGDAGIPPEQFDATCNELTELVCQMVDARTGKQMAQEIVRVRQSPWEDGADLSPADLMVLWNDELATDVVSHPRFGQIGPVPFFRTGGHATEGFVLARGPGFDRGRKMPAVETADVTATLLDRLGVDLPDHIDGSPIGRAPSLAG
ncbi:MAG: alkaline phosphatase family protein [Novosphingobium sp.]|nr:alkaline phosphatase family protein [Novosphingobium sp.]MCP5402265.1 alkaline phosphatase family protein [Novosphingobium sp.]